MDSIGELLYSRSNIRAFGPAIPQRACPTDCYVPLHQSYPPRPHELPTSANRPPLCTIPGAVPRKVEREKGQAWVFDRDVVTTWRLPDVPKAYDVFFWEQAFQCALGQETMWIAIEAFQDEEPGPYTAETLLGEFGCFVAGLGIQPVTVTISSLVQDMMEYYKSIQAPLHWNDTRSAEELEDFVENFVLSRDCFFYPAGRAPIVEATFACRINHRAYELDVDINYAWAPPLLNFHDLRNVVSEGEEFVLRPMAMNNRVYSTILPFTARYYVGPSKDWLHWDEDNECVRGIVPADGASRVGAERLEAYTMQLDLMASITKHFAGGIGLERVIRCSIPLTVKRRPDNCASNGEHVASPPVKAIATSFSPGPKGGSEKLCSPSKPLSTALDRTHTTRPPKQRAAVSEAARPPLRHTRSAPLRAFSALIHDKENAPTWTNIKELDQALQRKAQNAKSSSPPLNPLSLQRLYDATAPPSPPLNPLSLQRLYDVSPQEHLSSSQGVQRQSGMVTMHQFGTPLAVEEIELAHNLRHSMHGGGTTEMRSDSSEQLRLPKVRRRI